MSEKYNLVLRIFVILGILLLVNSGKLTGEVASGFIGIIVAYAFGKGKNDRQSARVIIYSIRIDLLLK